MSISAAAPTAAAPPAAAAPAQAASQAAAAPVAAPDVPEGGVSLFSGVLPRALLGGGIGAAAGFILPFGGPIIGGLLGAAAAGGFQLFKNFRTIRSVQEYNAQVLAQAGVIPTSEAEVEQLVAGQVPDQAATQAGVAGLMQQAAGDPAAQAAQQQATQQQAPGQGALPQQAAAADPAQAAAGATAAQASGQAPAPAPARDPRDDYEVRTSPAGNRYIIPKGFSFLTPTSQPEQQMLEEQMRYVHQHSVAQLEAVLGPQGGAGASAAPAAQQAVNGAGGARSEPQAQVAAAGVADVEQQVEELRKAVEMLQERIEQLREARRAREERDERAARGLA